MQTPDTGQSRHYPKQWRPYFERDTTSLRGKLTRAPLIELDRSNSPFYADSCVGGPRR